MARTQQYATSLVNVRSGASEKPLYITDKYPVYQVDFVAASTGKSFSLTKRRVRWRFGFSSPKAMDSGETGPECRGEEHEVSLVWSIYSGKRLIMVDGQEVHYSTRPKESKFEFSWTMRGNHTAKIVAHAMAPVMGKEGFKQFDFQLDGCSFFDFAKIYELGMSSKGGGEAAGPPVVPRRHREAYRNYALEGGGYEGDRLPQEVQFAQRREPWREEDTHKIQRVITHDTASYDSHKIQRAITHDTASYSRSEPHTEPVPTEEPLPSPTVQPSSSAPPPPTMEQAQDLLEQNIETKQDLLDIANEPISFTAPSYDQFSYQPGYQQQYAPPDEFAPQPMPSFAPPAPHQSFNTYQIMDAYHHTNDTPNEPQLNTLSHDYSTTPVKPTTFDSTTPTTEASSSRSPSPNQQHREEPVDDITDRIHKLVNLEDISSEPVQPTKLTMNEPPKKSKGKPPVGDTWYGGASLAEMKATKQQQPNVEVMRQPLAPAGPGAMVIYGNAPPPPQYQMGFGNAYGYAQQPNYART